MRKANIESLKEMARLLLMGAVTFLLTEGVINNLLITFLGTRMTAEQRLAVDGFILLALRGFDKWLHESKTAEKGLTRF